MSEEAGVHMFRSPLELELQAVVNFLMWALGIELMSSARAMCAEPSLSSRSFIFINAEHLPIAQSCSDIA